MYQLHIETDFSAAHNLRGYEGQCENLHGHNYRVEVELEGATLDSEGMLADFREIKRLCGKVVERLDHGYLNEIEPFDRINPTTENLAAHIADGLSELLPEGLRVSCVTCWESEKCAARFVPEHCGQGCVGNAE